MLYFKDKRYAFELKKFIDNTARVVSNDQHSCEQYCHDDFQTDASFYRDQQTFSVLAIISSQHSSTGLS